MRYDVSHAHHGAEEPRVLHLHVSHSEREHLPDWHHHVDRSLDADTDPSRPSRHLRSATAPEGARVSDEGSGLTDAQSEQQPSTMGLSGKIVSGAA